MDQVWAPHGYEIMTTEDQSPTLHWVDSETQEHMHHRGGAYTETQLIYGNPLRDSLDRGGRSAISVGLGIGYIEILCAVECLHRKIFPQDFRMLSFESEALLRDRFLAWVMSVESFEIYDLVLSFYLNGTAITSEQVKNWLKEAYQLGAWKSQAGLAADVEMTEKFHVIFYDAFSAKTSPHLWDEAFLTRFFKDACAEDCQVTTYACLGNLKRALRANGFEITVRDGFKSKRNSTLGIRKTFSS